ncbi:hypothetical protein SLE2022_102480 [Rubroshorea leprosula]
MASGGGDDHHGESSPLLSEQVEEDGCKVSSNENDNEPKDAEIAASPDSAYASAEDGYGWTADGLPLAHGSMFGERIAREQWDSSLMVCLGRNDEFCSSDLEVCKPAIVPSTFFFQLQIVPLPFYYKIR